MQRFEWGRLEMWLPGRPMQRKDCDNSKMLAALAKELRRLHTVAGRNHNDLNFTNVLVCDSAEFPTTNLLDFEYAGPLDPSFDIANFFCEWMYDCESTRWFEPDSTLFPSDLQARFFIAQYLRTTDCNDGEVSAFLKEVQARIPDVHAFWIDWAMTNFSDQDEYVQYAELRQLLKDHSLSVL
jgi:thiamine kinase-like enzyme